MAKLVEILARELGEWPEDQDSAWQSAFDLEIYFEGLERDGMVYATEAADDRGYPDDGVGVTREMWEAERAKVKGKTEWDGEGLPPVGTVCEAWHNGSAQGVVEVRYAGDCMVLWNVKGEYEQCSVAKDYSFRPIRTQEQISAQEREQAITDLMQTTCIRRGEAARIYDAGYRKQEQSE